MTFFRTTTQQNQLTQHRRRAFVAGASGAIGRVLCRLLVADGWFVVGTTRSSEKLTALRALGIEAVLVDVFDSKMLSRVVCEARADVVLHQLTDLPDGLDPAEMPAARIRNARIREEGTRNLVRAAVSAGTRRLVAQSIAFAYAPGARPYTEESPLALDDPALGVSARAVASLEEQVLRAPLHGVVLRYGKLYGPGTGFDRPASDGALHVDAAADAARRAASLGAPGIYNVAEADGYVSSAKVQQALGWSADFRLSRSTDPV